MNTYDYIFWYNPYEDLWYAIPREEQLYFFNGNRAKAKGVLSNKSINYLTIKINNEK
jgi:hypothetical protein